MKKTKKNKTSDETPDKGIKVRDKRFWNEDREEQPGDDEINSLMPSFVGALEKQLKEKEQEITTLGLAIRAQKDEQRKIVERLERQKASEILGMKCSFFENFLDIGDNFELCLKATENDATAEVDSNALTGVKMIYQQFMKALTDSGITKLDVVNKPFNPDHCEAVAAQDVTDKTQDNVVIEEYRSGYTIEDRLIRPARVTVGQHKEEVKDASQSSAKSD
jgi:molecular chaperone GrpE